MAKKSMLEQARKAYNKSASTKYRVQANGKRTKKKKEKVKSHYGSIQKKTQNTEENRREARNQTKNVVSKVGSNVVKKKTTESKPTTTGTNKQNGRRSGAITSVSSKSAERRTGAATARTTAKNVGNAVKTSTNLHKTPLKVTDVTQGTAKGTAAGVAYNKSKATDKALQKAGEKKTLTVSREQLTAEQKAAQERAARQTRFYTNSLVAAGRMTQKQADDAVEKARENAKKGVKEDHTLTYSNSAQSNETVQRVANASKFTNVEVEDKKAAEKAMREARFYANSQVAAGKMTQKEADRLVKQAGKGHRTTQSANILDKLGGEGEAERQGTRQAGQLNDSKFASGVMQGLSYADNTRAVGKYNKQAAELVDTVKQSGAFNTGYMVGQAGQFMLGGTGKMTDALVKGVAKSGAARSALNIGLRKAGADALFESPINALDAVKMSTDANGNFDKNAFVKYMALNTGLSGGMGGVIGGVGSKLAKNDAKAYITLSAKANSGAGLTEQEKVRLVNLQKKMDSIRNGNDVANTDIVNKADYDVEVSKKVFEKGGTVDDAIKVVNGGGTHTEKIGYANSIKETANAEFERLRVAREQMLEQARNTTPEEAKLLRAQASKLSSEINRLGEISNTAEKQLSIELKRNRKAVAELADNVKSMSDATGVNYRVVDDKQMRKLIKDAGGDVSDDYFYKGFYYKNKDGQTEILINGDSPQAHQTVIGHETGHLIKESNEKEFGELGDMLEEYAKKQDDFDAVYNQLKRSYPEASEAELREEVTCELLGRYVYGADDKFIKQLAGEKPSVVQRIVEYLKRLFDNTSDKEMAKELQAIIDKTSVLVKNIDKDADAKAINADYMKAAESGDIETAQKFADTLAKEKGYVVNAHRGGIQTAYDKEHGYYIGTMFSSDKNIASAFAYGNKENLGSYYLKMDKPLVIDAEGHSYVDVPVRDTHPDKELVEYAQNDIDYIGGERDYGSISVDDIGKWADEHGYDSVEIRNVKEGVGGEPATDYIVINPEQIKSADAITKDDNGNIIPLSERFDIGNNDIRFSKESKPKTKTPTESKPKTEKTETQKLSDNNNASAELKQALVDIDKAGVYKDDAEKVSKRFNDLESKIKKEVAHLKNAKKSDKYATEAERAERVAEIEDELKTLRNQQAKTAGKIEQMGKMKAVDDSIDPQDQFHQLRGETSRTNKELQNADNLKNEDNWIKDKWNSVRRLWEDSLIEVENVAKRSDDKKLREEILTSANRVRNSQNVANFWITKGRSSFDNKVSGKSLDEIFPKELLENEAKYKDFQEYLIMKHVPARHEKGTDIYPEVSPELADKIVKKLEGKYGKELTSWADDVYGYLKDLQQYRVDSGMLSQKAADQFAKDYPFYVPTNRVNEDEAIDFFTGGLSNQIRTAKGGENDVLDMYSQLYTATNKTIHAAEENEMLNLYFRAKGVTPEQIKGAELPDLEHAVINATVNKKTGSAKVSFFIDGKPVEFPCSHQLALGLRELDGLEFERLMNAAKVSTLYGKPFKALITDWNLVFGVRNGMRDMQQAVVNSKDTRYFGSSFGAAGHAIAHEDSPYRKLYASMGGERAQLVSYDAVAKNLGIEKQGKIDALHEKAQDWVDAEIKGVHTNPIHYIEGINGAIEMMPRMCEFIGTLRKEANSVLKKQGSSLKKLRKEIIDEVNALEKEGKIGQSEIPAEVENRLANRIIEMVDKDTIDSAMRNANDITLNFGRSGVLGKALNMGFVPYLNPSIQGLSKLVRLFTEAGGEGGWKALASLGMKLGTFTIAPAVFNELALRNNEEYQNLNTRDKDNNFFIALGDGKFIKIPKPRENAVLAEPVEYGLRYFLDKSEYAFFDWGKLKMEDVPLWEKIPLTDEGKQSLRTAVDNIGVINPMTSNMVSPLWQTFHNKTWYGGSIESAYETAINEDTGKANVPVNKRYDTGTSGVAIWLGQSKVAKELNLSPKKIDNILDSYTGMIYDLGISQTTEEAKTRGNYLLRTAASQFLKDSVFSNKLSTKAWEKIDGMTKKEQDEYKSKYMYDAYKYDDAMDAITADKNMTVKEKMDAKRALQKQRNKLYRAAINGEENTTNPLKDISKYLGANKTLNKFLPKSGDEKYDNWTDYYKNYKKTKGYKGLTPSQKEKEAQKFLDVYTLGVRGQSKVSGDFHDSPSWGMTGVAAAQRYKQGKLSQKDAKTIMESCGVYESQTASYFKYADHGGNVSRYAVTKKNNNKAEDLAESLGVTTSGDGSIWKNKYSKEKGIKGGVLSMSLATGKADFKDRAYYISNSGDSNMLIKMNAARGYAEKYGHSTKQLIKLGKKADSDGNTYLSNEEIESACQTIKKGKATSEEKAMAWVLLGGNPNKNPFGAIGDYSHDGDTGITMDEEEKSGGRGGHGWGRRRHRGGGGGGSSKGTMPKTASGAIKGTVSDPFSGISRIGGRSGGSASTNTRKSNLNDAYRKRVKKLRQNLS